MIALTINNDEDDDEVSYYSEKITKLTQDEIKEDKCNQHVLNILYG